MAINRVMVAGLTAERQYIASLQSFNLIDLQPGDGMYLQHGTRGDVGRTIVCDKFLQSDYDALFLCDLDQEFDKDVLTRLRSHDKDMVSGHYTKRTSKSLSSIWQWSVLPGDWPYIPYIDPPKTGLHRIASTGMGCVLIKRAAIEAVANILPPGASPFEIGKLPTLAVVQANYGSDYRFFYLAQQLGFELWGDADIDTPHAGTTWYTRDTLNDLQTKRDDWQNMLFTLVFQNSIKAKGMINANAVQARLLILQEQLEKAEEDSDEYKVISGQITECEMWLSELVASAPPAPVLDYWIKHYGWPTDKPNTRPIEYAGGKTTNFALPSFDSVEAAERAASNRERAIGGEDEELAKAMRVEMRRNEAVKTAALISNGNKNGTRAGVTSSEPGKFEKIG